MMTLILDTSTTRYLSKSQLNLLLSLLFCSFLSACASTATVPNDKAYPKGHDLFGERRKAIELYRDEQFNDALAIYNRLVVSVPEDAELWFRKGNIHARISQPELAIQAYQKALVRDQRYYKAWRNMSSIQLRQAANSMTQLMSILPANHQLYADSLSLTENILLLIGEKHINKPSDKPAIEDIEIRAAEGIQ
jgi:tetratricopeptide (TPR) repeat protein